MPASLKIEDRPVNKSCNSIASFSEEVNREDSRITCMAEFTSLALLKFSLIILVPYSLEDRVMLEVLFALYL